MTKEKHVHKFKRLIYKSGNVTFFCTLPDCSHKINPALALGKRSLCWRCGEEFILDEYALRLAKPHCSACHKPKKMTAEEIKKVEIETIKEIEPSLLTLSERLQQTIQSARQNQQQDEEI
jgi:hypothetical protein